MKEFQILLMQYRLCNALDDNAFILVWLASAAVCCSAIELLSTEEPALAKILTKNAVN